ncbi:hypothetical protein K458DRAFT_392284 [Lentithecium fluviatile CBS 122367]|uniref:Uncharacterized protein n=1 Tax=Lentithecium fluviatile CBS 122367 TaxID=1168545 RepID=A0A6G1IS30_9PLEO|nr:hypothetical protein K458DRAFT_392284 [Lentithecium fluviatile CBS 122367]
MQTEYRQTGRRRGRREGGGEAARAGAGGAGAGTGAVANISHRGMLHASVAHGRQARCQRGSWPERPTRGTLDAAAGGRELRGAAGFHGHSICAGGYSFDSAIETLDARERLCGGRCLIKRRQAARRRLHKSSGSPDTDLALFTQKADATISNSHYEHAAFPERHPAHSLSECLSNPTPTPSAVQRGRVLDTCHVFSFSLCCPQRQPSSACMMVNARQRRP